MKPTYYAIGCAVRTVTRSGAHLVRSSRQRDMRSAHQRFARGSLKRRTPSDAQLHARALAESDLSIHSPYRQSIALNRLPVSTFVALSRELQKVYPVPQDLLDSIARALARLEPFRKGRPQRHGRDEQAAA
jgi:hypothetical protein